MQEDKARMEMAKTLQSRNADESGRSRAEIDASVKYAQVNNRKTFAFVSQLSVIAKDADPMSSTAAAIPKLVFN